MGIEVNSSGSVCFKCGKSYGRRKGNFLVNYGALYKGIGYMPVCKECVDTMYNTYLAQCNDAATAVRQMCRKFDLYWNENLFEIVSRKNTTRTMMTSYITKINTITYAGKCYDDTLSEEGTLWSFGQKVAEVEPDEPTTEEVEEDITEDDYEISDEVKDYWGGCYDDNKSYYDLEKRREYWMSSMADGGKLDAGVEAIIKQICPLEVDINRFRAEGRDVDKLITSLDKLIGRLKSTQKQSDNDSDIANTPLGVWTYRYEEKRPLPEIDDDLKDVNKILKYVFIWLGHVCKMLGKKNGFARLYEAEMKRLRVEKPEYDEEDDEEMLMDIFDSEDEIGGDLL